jgi:two-component system, chemotaxis family, protein-glutamate methylesterase/glutaminase
MRKIKVMIVDDSAVVRQVIKGLLAEAPDIEIISTAADPVFAMQHMQRQWPDVIIMDVEMPRMDGITFLRKIMAEHPTPVIICSSLTEKGAQTTMQALAAGAVEVLTKPRLGVSDYLRNAAHDLLHAVRAAASANVRRLTTPPTPRQTADAVLPAGGQSMAQTSDKIIAIGTSTGGTQALEVVLKALPQDCPGLIIVQHMPEKFTAAFAARLDTLCRIKVREAQHHDRILPGQALIAPGGRHMMMKRSGAQYHVEVIDGPLVNRHRPSVDVLFRSVAKFAGANAIGVIMTGMGDDGARGLKEMHDAGAYTMAQDEHSCVVYGMPREAVKLGAADQVVALGDIPAALLAHCSR